MSKGKKIAGMVLIVLGLLAIGSVIIVPRINRRDNDRAIEEIRAGTGASVDSTQESVSVPAAEPATDTAAEPAAQDERQRRMDEILADGTRIGIVEIEKIGVLYAIVEGTEDEQINRAVGHLSSSAGIGQKGNCVIAGHRGGYFGTFFERVPELELGDVVTLTDLQGTEYEYVVYDKRMIDPADWSVTKNLNQLHTLTMITCENDTQKRIAVSAVLYEP